ncbi:MAG: glycosyltransferase [Gemmatimonadaceae bacterium]
MTGDGTTAGVRLTVAICTWNRCELLRQTLEQMTRLVIPAGIDWELLVVNNNCTDRTDDVLAEFASRLPIRRLFEPSAGLSHARNRALREATGEYVLWTDDDVLVAERWVAEYCAAFAQWPEAAIFGGPIDPVFVGTPPDWLPDVLPRVSAVFALLDLGDEARAFDAAATPFGANMVVRTSEQRRYPYDPTLGLSWGRPRSLLGGEETAVLERMIADGIQGRWVPTARVRHFIPTHRQRISVIRRYFIGYGEYNAREAKADGAPYLFGRPRWWWRQAVESELRYRVRRLFSRPEAWIEDLITSSVYWGQLRAYASAGRPVGGTPPAASMTDRASPR